MAAGGKRKRAAQTRRLARLYGGGGGGERSRGGHGTGGRASSANNPFDYKHGTQRFEVLGKTRMSGPTGGKQSNKKRQKVSVKHDEGIRKRERSLLVEYNRRFNANTFLDKRFGEVSSAR